MSCQRGISDSTIHAPIYHKLTTKRKRVQALHRPWNNQSAELYKYCPQLVSPKELLIRQLFYKYHNAEKSSVPCKPSYAPPEGACGKRRGLRPVVPSSTSCGINPKVCPMESTASFFSKSSSHAPSKASNRHFEFSARDRSRLGLSSSSRPSQLCNYLRLNCSTSSHCSDASKRLRELAQSKQPPRIVSAKQPWQLTWSMRTFQPSERLLKLASSRMPSAGKLHNPFRVPKRALNYKATERINLLAVPRKKTLADDETLESQSRPIRKLLPGQLTPRLENLATPKLREDTTLRRKPYTVRRRAMHAKLTPRLEKLAQPRQQCGRIGKESLPF
ncbi:uncharacterized protein LOC111073318 [Drosophila obscura]|uniref:uncharacterized protein LOC111073318 n=1 Tax=Drosophila obscura TaxID=7282 RepID=UPI001BB21D3A|nr:uncharacterized protein LOC111073318 [Drosophila obscura]